MSQFLGWTKEKVEYLKQNGKVRGFSDTLPPKKNAHNPVKNIPARSKQKEWLSWNIPFWCNEHALTLETEYQFHAERKWRFDFAIPALKIAIEYEGIFKNKQMKENDIEKSVHSSVKGVMRDIEKYNAATAGGWRIIRLTADNYKTVLQLLNAVEK